MFTVIEKLFQNKLIRFFLVSGLNTVFGYGIFVLLLWMGLHYTWVLFIGTILGILFNFKTYGQLVFNSKNNKLIFKFILVYGIIYLFNYVGLSIFLHYNISTYIGGAILAIPAGFLGFALNKVFVFPKISK